MHSKTLLYDIILVAQMFTALVAPSMANPHTMRRAKAVRRAVILLLMKLKVRKLKSKARLTSNWRNDRYQSTGPLEKMAKYGRTSLQRSELPFIAKGTATGL
jgi:hypothetical protein